MAKHCYSYDNKTYVCVQKSNNTIIFNDQKIYYLALLDKRYNTPLRAYSKKMFATIEEADKYIDSEAKRRMWQEY